MPVRLRYLAHDLEVPPGEFVIGRSPECQLSLDDALVSRRHAILVVHPDAVFIEDLGSRNGVLVNSRRIQMPTRVNDGDQITVGSQIMTLVGVPGSEPVVPDAAAMSARRGGKGADIITLTGTENDNDDLAASTQESKTQQLPTENPDKRVSSLALIGGLAEKALAMGRADEAERILSRSLREVLYKARARDDIRAELAEKAAFYAARLAQSSGRGLWIDYIFELYLLLATLLPAKLVDELFTVMRKVKSDRTLVSAYVDMFRKNDHLSPGDRFIRQRIEGLERLVAMK